MHRHRTSVRRCFSSTVGNATSPFPSPSSSQPPPPRYFTRATLYPFLCLSIITSLALNISQGRARFQEESSLLHAQLSVLDRLRTRLRTRKAGSIGELETEEIERELEMVGLGRGKDKGKGKMQADAAGAETGAEEKGTTWKEVFLGKKGVEWAERAQDDGEDVDWEKIVREAEAVDQARMRPKRRLPIVVEGISSSEGEKSKPAAKTLATFL